MPPESVLLVDSISTKQRPALPKPQECVPIAPRCLVQQGGIGLSAAMGAQGTACRVEHAQQMSLNWSHVRTLPHRSVAHAAHCRVERSSFGSVVVPRAAAVLVKTAAAARVSSTSSVRAQKQPMLSVGIAPL